MGVARCAAICEALIQGGLPQETPAAIVQSAWQENERRHATTLRLLPLDVARLGYGSPSILVIGAVARYAVVAQIEAKIQSR